MKYRFRITIFLTLLILGSALLIMLVSTRKTTAILRDESLSQAELELNSIYSTFNKTTAQISQSYAPLVYNTALQSCLLEDYSLSNSMRIKSIIDTVPFASESACSISVYSMSHGYIISTLSSKTKSTTSEYTKD